MNFIQRLFGLYAPSPSGWHSLPRCFPHPFPSGAIRYYPVRSPTHSHSASPSLSIPHQTISANAIRPYGPSLPRRFPLSIWHTHTKSFRPFISLHYLCANTSSPSVITRACLSPLFIFFLLFTPTKHLYLHSFSDKTALLFVFYRSKRINQWSWLHALSVSKCYGVG